MFALSQPRSPRSASCRFTGKVELAGTGIDEDCDGLVDEGGRLATYELDPVGNRKRLSDTAAGETLSEYNAFNQLERSIDGAGRETRYFYDRRGNVVRREEPGSVVELLYDARNLLVEVKRDGSTVARYGYDTSGLRVRIEDAEGTRLLLIDPMQQIEIAEYSESGQLLRRYEHNPGRVDELLWQQEAGGERMYAMSDALGSVTGLADGDGIQRLSRQFDAYGSLMSESGTASSSLGFTGRRFDSTLKGLGSNGGDIGYFRARWYDTNIGAFLQVDPAQGAVGPNPWGHRYVYVNGMPTKYIDPTGMYLDSARAAFIAQPGLFVEVMRALGYGMLRHGAAVGLAAAGAATQVTGDCPWTVPQDEEFYRGDSLKRAEDIVAYGFVQAGIGTQTEGFGQHEFGAGLYMSRSIETAQSFEIANLQRPEAREWGGAALLYITIPSAVWRFVVAVGAGEVRDNVPLMPRGTGFQTFVPAGRPLELFDGASTRDIIHRWTL